MFHVFINFYIYMSLFLKSYIVIDARSIIISNSKNSISITINIAPIALYICMYIIDILYKESINMFKYDLCN